MKTDNRPVRFLRPWGGRPIGAIGLPRDLGYGQRQTLVTHNIAEWVNDETVQRQKQKRQLHKETSE